MQVLSLALLVAQCRGVKEELPEQAGEKPASWTSSSHTLDDGDRDGDPHGGQSWTLQVTSVQGVSGGAVLNGQYQALASWCVD